MGIEALSVNDPSSFANTEDVLIRHAHIIWKVDFQKQTVAGSVKLTFEKLSDFLEKVILDTNKITVKNISWDGLPLIFHKGPTIGTFGESLTVIIPSDVPKKFDLFIEYETSSNASALQWLPPAQTAGKTHPYLFSQCQSIHCRSIMPCQDSPFVKLTYSAAVDADSELTVLMSAVSSGTPQLVPGTELKRHNYEQRVAIPSCLLAIVVAKITSREISPRSRVWSEDQMVDAAAWEFGQTEQKLKFAEEICGPYEWGRYDILVLPPSFAYGGMENPCLTFVNPTTVVGDRSLADVISHEISHSWTGNSVGMKNFEHYWLNEGWTMFIQRKIESRLYGEKQRHFSAIVGLDELEDTLVNGCNDPVDAQLVKNLTGIDPEDVYNNVPYEKGHSLLFHLETILGGAEAFDPFVKSYCQDLKGRGITTTEFKSFLYQYFASKKAILDSVDWENWFYGVGMPPVIPKYDTTLSDQCREVAKKWISCPEDKLNSLVSGTGASYKDLLSCLQQMVFFDTLILSEQCISIGKLMKMDEWYGLRATQNAEIKIRWLKLCIKARWVERIPDCIKFATVQGRMRYVRPMFRGLYDWPAARDQAIEAFKAHRTEYMYLTARQVSLDLNLE